MSEERFDRLEQMIGETQNQVSQMQNQVGQMQNLMEQLIKMVGHNNAVTEELRERMDKLETKVDCMETQMQAGFAGLTAMVNLLGEKVNTIPHLESKLETLNDYILDQAADIRMLKKAR